MNWRNAKYEDLHRVKLKTDPNSADMLSILPDTDSSRELLDRYGRTWMDGDTTLAVVGIAPQWKGVGTVWTLLSDEARGHGVALTRGMLRYLAMLHREWNYWRLQATVEAGDEAARLWIIQLGFQYEGTMVAYGPDLKNHDLYARVRF